MVSIIIVKQQQSNDWSLHLRSVLKYMPSIEYVMLLLHDKYFALRLISSIITFQDIYYKL